VRRWVRMRAGVVGLEEETGRHRRIWRRKRVCRWCESGSVENVGHVLDECVKWNEERREMWAEVEREDVGVMRVMMGWSRRERVEWLLKGGKKKMRMGVMRRATWLLFRREKEGEGRSQAVKDKKESEKSLKMLLAEKSFREVMKVKVGGEGRMTKKKVVTWMKDRKKLNGECKRWERLKLVGEETAMEVQKMIDRNSNGNGNGNSSGNSDGIGNGNDNGDDNMSNGGGGDDSGMVVDSKGCVIRVGYIVMTEWGKANVVKVYDDGDIRCVWDGYENEYVITGCEVYVDMV